MSRGEAPCPDTGAIDRATATLLGLLPESAVRAGLPVSLGGGAAARACDDPSPEGGAALALALAAARAALPADCATPALVATRTLLDRALRTAAIGYGRNDPLAASHRPYRVTAFCGPQIDTPAAMILMQDIGSTAAVDAWQAKLGAYGEALLGLSRALRADEAAGCVPPATISRAALAGIDRFVATPADLHPLVRALPEPARAAAATTLVDHVQPAMALLRDTVAALTRAGRADIGVWAQPHGDTLYAANLAHTGDTDLTPDDAQRLARDEVARIASLLDKRLAARGLRTGTIAERIAAAFADRPGLLATDDPAALLRAASETIAAAHAALPKLVPPALALTEAPVVRGLAASGVQTAAGSVYLPAGARAATVWIDDRSAYALPVPGVAPIAFDLALPGRHLLASAGAASAMPAIVRAAAWPAMTAGWGAYAVRLAAEQGLFRTDPWGDIARLADELLRAARLVIDVGIHAQHWSRERAEAEMTALTGDRQIAAIDRITALPGEAASATLGLHALLDARDAAKRKDGKAFDLKTFHAAVLDGGARPFAAITSG